MSDKTRRKKDGHDTNKDAQAMHAAVREREESSRPKPRPADQGDVASHGSGHASHRSRQGSP